MQGVVHGSRPAEGVRGLRLTTVWMIAAVAVPTALVLATPLSSVDLAYQLRAGAMTLDAGHVLRTDPFTVAALGHPWLNQQWGASVLFAALFHAGGWFALAGLRAVCATLVTAMVYASCRNAGASRRWATGLTLAGGVLATGGFLVRAQLLGMVCFAATQWLLSRRDRHPLGVLWILPVTIVWANTHGSFFLAPVLCAIALADPARRERRATWRLPAIAAATLAMTLLNPFGPRVWGYVLTIGGDPRIRNVATEWQAPTLQTWAGALFLVSVVAAALFVGAHWSRASWPMLAGLGFFLVLGLISIRGTLWWALAAPALLARLRPGDDQAERRDPRGSVNVALAAVFCLIAVAPLLRWVPYTSAATPPALVTAAPAGITRELSHALDPGEAFFNPQGWSSWFEFALPSNPVLVDSRFEVIPDEAWEAYDHVLAGASDWQAILDRYGMRVVVLSREQEAGLLRIIEGDPGWRLIYQDAEGTIFERIGSG